jgi:hypothetical protein
MRKKKLNTKKLNIKKLIDSLKEKYGELEVDGKYGEQCKFEESLDILLEKTITFHPPRQVWESSKRVLDAKEVEIWTKWKCR